MSKHYKSENIMSKQGTAARYRIAKLKRDYPLIAARLEAGEIKKRNTAFL